MKHIWTLALLGISVCAAAQDSESGLTSVVVKRPDDNAARITDLDLARKDPEVTSGQARGEMDLQVYVKFEGRYTKADSSLLYRNQPVTRSKDGDTVGQFTLNVPVHGTKTTVRLLAVAPSGELQKEEVEIEFPKWKEYLKSLKGDAYKKRFVVSPSLGVSSISYSQSNLSGDYSSISLTAKAAAQFWILPPKFDVGLNAYYTLLPITKSRAEALRFFGANLRFGYVLPFLESPWKLSLLGGAYYTRTFVSGSAFGFTDTVGPQIYPTLQRTLNNGDTVHGYFKFSPVTDGVSFLSLSNREIAIGGGWSHTLANGFPISVMADFANLALQIGTVSISTTSFTLSAGTGF